MSQVTVLRGLSWAVVWDPDKGRHVYRQGVDVAFANGVISAIQSRYVGAFDRELDGSDCLLLPGWINIHSHPSSEPLRKGITDEILSPGFHHSSLYEFLNVFDNDSAGRIASLKVALAELLLSGCTTVSDLSSPYEGWIETLVESGIRAVVAPGFRDARWFTRDGYSLEYEWDQSRTGRAFAQAVQIIEDVERHPNSLLTGMLYPAQVDTCTPETLRDSFELSVEKGIPWQIHAAQSVIEFHEVFRRYGKTPIQWLEQLGVLGPNTIVGHGIFLDHHPWLHWTSNVDLPLLAERQVSVAHCPTVFGRRGIALRTFGDYLRAGVNLGIGTDTYPHNFLDEVRSALNFARVIGESVADVKTSDVFNAGTVGGATALGRRDLGRISVGARADFSLVDLNNLHMKPMREPIRSLVYVALERAVRDVYVDGKCVVRDGKVLTFDHMAAAVELEEAQQRSLARVPDQDWAGRKHDELSPMVFSLEK